MRGFGLTAKSAPWTVALGLLVTLGAACLPPALAKPESRSSAAANAGARPDPDAMLIAVYKDLAANNLRSAMSRADALVAAYPNFQLGHLIRGDLLLMHTRPVTSFGAAPGAPSDKLANLREEALARIRSLRERPDPSLVPRPLLRLRADQRNALLVDAGRSRLYVYANRGGELKYVADYYISQGKFGVDKYKEGDQKTPLGVYYITGNLAGKRLPDFYGPGALPISYPNEWDKRNGRSGSGIWLHGTPSTNFSRPPLSSDGCVVLTNPDLLKLAGEVDVGKTPVIISEHIEFVPRVRLVIEREQTDALLERWRADLESLDPARLRVHYSDRFRSEHGDDLQGWFDRQKKTAPRPVSVSLRDTSFFRYPGKEELIVVGFTQDTRLGKKTYSQRKRQYWAREGTRWRIVSETAF